MQEGDAEMYQRTGLVISRSSLDVGFAVQLLVQGCGTEGIDSISVGAGAEVLKGESYKAAAVRYEMEVSVCSRV